MSDKKKFEIYMPKLGLSPNRGTIVKWLKNDGDFINKGEKLLEVESDKAIVEVEANHSGILEIIKDNNDGELEIGTVIGRLIE